MSKCFQDKTVWSIIFTLFSLLVKGKTGIQPFFFCVIFSILIKVLVTYVSRLSLYSFFSYSKILIFGTTVKPV